MGRLENPNHEKFAREIVKHDGHAAQAYAATFPTASESTAKSNGFQLIRRSEIISRAREIAHERGITLEHLSERLLFFTKRNDAMGLDATKFGFKLHGALDRNEEDDAPRDFEITVNVLNSSKAA